MAVVATDFITTDIDRSAARRMYAALREQYQWLPESSHVSGADQLRLAFGLHEVTTLTLTVLLPSGVDFAPLAAPPEQP